MTNQAQLIVASGRLANRGPLNQHNTNKAACNKERLLVNLGLIVQDILLIPLNLLK